MHRLLLITLPTLLLIFACTGGGKERIPPDKMALILADIYTAEAYIDIAKEPQKDSLALLYYGQIFARHDVNKADFDSTMIFLTRNPEEMESIQHKALEKLENLKKKEPAVLKR